MNAESATPANRWYSGMPSPNPGGRPKASQQMQELAREHTPEAIAKILALMNDPKSTRAMQLAAARELLDRAYGRPAQTIQGPNETPLLPVTEVSLLERARRIAFVLNRALPVVDSKPALEQKLHESTTENPDAAP